jgi:D-alanine-D-alanine ligase
MTQQKNVLLICGGGGSEHDISLVSADYIKSKLELIEDINLLYLVIEKDSSRKNEKGQDCELRKAGEVYNRETKQTTKLDYVIPCFHGPPGETGQIQAVFEMMGLPYLGAGSEGSINCFNKATTKLWLSDLNIKNSPFIVVNEHTREEKTKEIEEFFIKSKNDIFIKATHQGSSVGCYHVLDVADIAGALTEALKLSPFALVEKTIKGRELEVSVFEYNGEIHATKPGEIDCPSEFYTYEEKYAQDSKTKTLAEAPNITPEQVEEIRKTAIKTFKGLYLKDMARVDFFLTEDNEIFVNEINTFPGHTPISMFPMMMENYGVKYEEFLKDRIFNN